MPAAVSLSSISYNIARSLGPALGGILVAAAGAGAAFVATAVGLTPMLGVLYAWPKRRVSSRLPPEPLGHAIRTGVRYVRHAPQIATVLARTLAMALAGAAVAALMPMVVRHQLGGDARLYGAMLASFGVGGIISAALAPRVRRTCDAEQTVRVCLLVQTAAALAIAYSHSAVVTGLALVASGAAWMMASVHFNVGVQLSAPRWVAGRVLSIYQATITAGTGIGSWIWGEVAAATDLKTPYVLSALGMLLTLLLGFRLRMPHVDGLHRELAATAEPTAEELAVDGRRGPVAVSLEYRVPAAEAERFQETMRAVRASRLRNGGDRWRLERDAADPELWTERWRHPTWHDYLRRRDQMGAVDRRLQDQALAFHQGPAPARLRLDVRRRAIPNGGGDVE
jgi:hypothetical protein